MRTKCCLGYALTVIALAGIPEVFAQGSLTPTGPPGPTMKTLSQVEPRTPISSIPYTISSPGSYYLTTNLVTSNTAGIFISANNVALDLNGFAMIGTSNSFYAIASNTGTNVTVRNGTITGWGTYGVYLQGPNISLKDLIVSGNAFGVILSGPALVESCIVETNRSTGISAGQNVVVRKCTVIANTGDGILTGTGSQIEDCVCNGNGGSGMRVNNLTSIVRCTAVQNNGDGAVLPDGDRVTESNFSGNTGNGINASFGVDITRCTVTFNQSNGIMAGARCSVLDNHLYGNGFNNSLNAGIYIPTNSFNLGGVRIEGNHITNGRIGIRVAGPGNFITRNSVSGMNTNYVISANNAVGPIVTPPGSVAISGSTGGSGVGSTDPSANFSF